MCSQKPNYTYKMLQNKSQQLKKAHMVVLTTKAVNEPQETDKAITSGEKYLKLKD